MTTTTTLNPGHSSPTTKKNTLRACVVDSTTQLRFCAGAGVEVAAL